MQSVRCRCATSKRMRFAPGRRRLRRTWTRTVATAPGEAMGASNTGLAVEADPEPGRLGHHHHGVGVGDGQCRRGGCFLLGEEDGPASPVDLALETQFLKRQDGAAAGRRSGDRDALDLRRRPGLDRRGDRNGGSDPLEVALRQRQGAGRRRHGVGGRRIGIDRRRRRDDRRRRGRRGRLSRSAHVKGCREVARPRRWRRRLNLGRLPHAEGRRRGLRQRAIRGEESSGEERPGLHAAPSEATPAPSGLGRRARRCKPKR